MPLRPLVEPYFATSSREQHACHVAKRELLKREIAGKRKNPAEFGRVLCVDVSVLFVLEALGPPSLLRSLPPLRSRRPPIRRCRTPHLRRLRPRRTLLLRPSHPLR